MPITIPPTILRQLPMQVFIVFKFVKLLVPIEPIFKPGFQTCYAKANPM